jgi:hypothetical protein
VNYLFVFLFAAMGIVPWGGIATIVCPDFWPIGMAVQMIGIVGLLTVLMYLRLK